MSVGGGGGPALAVARNLDAGTVVTLFADPAIKYPGHDSWVTP